MRSDRLCGLLAEPDRLMVFAAVVLGAGTPTEVAERTGLPARTVAAAIQRLADGGLIETGGGQGGTGGGRDGTGGGLVARHEAFKEAVRARVAGSGRAGPDDAGRLDPDRQRDTVLRTFIVDSRLVRFPAARGKRRIVLEHIVECFEPGVRYPERAVNAVLRAWNEDAAALRRYLVDEGLMAREHGVYWRTGGYVAV